MRTQDDTPEAGSAPRGEDEARSHDWQPVIDAIGTHPDLQLRDGVWWVRYMAPGYGTIHATPATVDGLMLDHATAWLDEHGIHVRWASEENGFCVRCISRGHKALRAGRIFSYNRWSTRISATIAAVVAAKEGGRE